jgi:putative transposase
MKFSQSELLKGRNAGMALRALQYHKKRTAAGMLPWDELHADGWASHFTAPHPVTGEYVTYELWDVHDVATRYIPPFAIGLTKNYEVIAKAVENAIRDNGIMAILQTDSTKIVKKNVKFVGNPVLSIAERAGITIVHPKTVGNAQANGIAENFHAWLDKK